MKKLLYVWAIAAAIAMFVSGCGDDVINVKNEEIYALVDSLADTSCTKDNEGAFAMVKGTGKMYTCKDGDWTIVNGEEAVHLRCQSEALEDSIGYNIICDGDTIGTVYNGVNGVSGTSGKNGKNGTSCSLDTTDGVATLSCGGLEFSIKNGKDGEGCSLDTATEKITCGSETFDINLKGVEIDLDSLKKAVVDSVIVHLVDTLEKKVEEKTAPIKSEIIKDLKDPTTELRKTLDTIIVKQVDDMGNKLTEKINSLEKTLTTVIESSIKEVLEKLEATDKTLKDLKTLVEGTIKEQLDDLEGRVDALEGRCYIGKIETDEALSIQKVTVKCGEDQSELELLIPNKNLEKEYSKHVVVRFPVQTQKDSYTEDIYEELWKSLKSGNFSELSIMELDQKLDPTGKTFVSDLVASNTKSFVTIEEVNEKEVYYVVARLEGDFNVTNLANSVVQLRVHLNFCHLDWMGNCDGVSADFVNSAVVNLADEGDIAIDFLTDYKAERVRHLVKNENLTYSEASAQANADVVTAFALAENAKNFPALESYVKDEIGLNEYVNGVIWPMALFDQANYVNKNEYAFNVNNISKVYADYRKTFAENGNFNTALNERFNDEEQSLFFVDYLALLVYINFERYTLAKDEWGNIDWNTFWNYQFETYYQSYDEPLYKIIQKNFRSAYKLPEIDKDSLYFVKGVEGGYFKFFRYDSQMKIWWPDSKESVLGAASDGNLEEYVHSVDPTLQCNDNSDPVSLGYDGVNAACVCQEAEYLDARIENARAQVALAQTAIRRVASVAAEEAPAAAPAAADAPVSEAPAALKLCRWQLVNDEQDESEGSEETEETEESSTLNERMFGKCNEEIMKKYELKEFNKCEAKLATTSCQGLFKCDCDSYIDDDGTVVYENCEWVEASQTEIELKDPCTEDRVRSKKMTDDEEYICKDVDGVNDWYVPEGSDLCNKLGMAKTPTPKYPDGEDAAMRDNVDQYCVVGEGDEVEYYVKETGSDDWKSASTHLGTCEKVGSYPKNAKVLMYGFNESQIYYCCTANSCSGNYELSGADNIISVLNNIQNGSWDEVGKKVQFLMNYEMYDETSAPRTASGVAYKYRGTAQIRSNTAKEYVSHDRETWYELNSALGSTTYYTGSAKKPTDGWCYDPENVQTPTKKYDNDPVMIDNVVAYCVKGDVTVVKESENGGWKTAAQHLGDCNGGAAILMDGFKYAEIYTCVNGNDGTVWTKKALDEFVTYAEDMGDNFSEKNKEIQNRYTFEMPSSGFMGFIYKGTMTNSSGEESLYGSNDKVHWYTGVDDYCNEIKNPGNWENGSSSCDEANVCEFGDNAYYYDFITSTWKTLAEMEIEGECPDMTTYCEAHAQSTYGATCSAQSAQCYNDNDDDDDDDDSEMCDISLDCDYPFKPLSSGLHCTWDSEDGEWEFVR